MHKILLPELGEGIVKATVACWHYRPGDKVAVDDDIVEVVTDKATFNIASEQSGTVKEIFFKEGQDAKVGEVLALIQPDQQEQR